MSQEIVWIDGVKWWKVVDSNKSRTVSPICPNHNLRLYASPSGRVLGSHGRMRDMLDSEANKLKCAEGPHFIDIPRQFADEVRYVHNRIDAQVFAGMKTIDLDGELTPVAKAKDKNDVYFATVQIMESKRGPQLVVYAGEKGRNDKTQIIIDPKNKKLSFDHKNIDPTDIFIKIRATFDDGTSHEIKKGEK